MVLVCALSSSWRSTAARTSNDVPGSSDEEDKMTSCNSPWSSFEEFICCPPAFGYNSPRFVRSAVTSLPASLQGYNRPAFVSRQSHQPSTSCSVARKLVLLSALAYIPTHP